MLGSRIAQLRRAAGWNQAELARRIGVSPSAIGMYEQSRREPSVDHLVMLAREFRVTLDYLLTGSDGPAQAPPITILLQTGDGRIFNAANPGKNLSYNEIAILLSAILCEES